MNQTIDFVGSFLHNDFIKRHKFLLYKMGITLWYDIEIFNILNIVSLFWCSNFGKIIYNNLTIFTTIPRLRCSENFIPIDVLGRHSIWNVFNWYAKIKEYVKLVQNSIGPCRKYFQDILKIHTIWTELWDLAKITTTLVGQFLEVSKNWVKLWIFINSIFLSHFLDIFFGPQKLLNQTFN